VRAAPEEAERKAMKPSKSCFSDAIVKLPTLGVLETPTGVGCLEKLTSGEGVSDDLSPVETEH
jgi:hypothetical protein